MKIPSLLFFSMLPFLVAEVPQVEPETGLPLVFQDDFEKGRDRWEVTDESSWKHHQQGSNHVFSIIKRKSSYVPKYRSPGHIAIIKNLELSDFVLIYHVKGPMPKNANHRDSCAFFNYQSSNEFYYVHTGLKPDPNSGQIMIVNNAARTPLTKNKNLTPWKVDTWHQVKVVRDSKKGSIEIYFDDMNKPYMKTNSKTFGKGRIGIGSFDDYNDFDNVRVYGR
jgi:hypothetical protein